MDKDVKVILVDEGRSKALLLYNRGIFVPSLTEEERMSF